MKLKSLVIFFAAMCAALGNAQTIDDPMVVSTAEQVFERLMSLRATLSEQELLDLEVAVRCIERQCDVSLKAGLVEEERDRLFVGLFDGRSPRQIILFAAALMFCESTQESETQDLDSTAARAKEKHLAATKMRAVYFVRTYGHQNVRKPTELR